MINLTELQQIKSMKLNASYFNWTRSALIYLNLIGFVTLTVVVFQKNKEFMDFVGNLPIMILIMTTISLVIFPIVDIYEFLLKKRICKLLQIDFESEFISKLPSKDIDEIKKLYLDLLKSANDEQDVKSKIHSKFTELTNSD